MSNQKHDQKSYRIVHATDLLPDGQTTFDHAVALARDTEGELVSLHVTDEEADAEMPDPEEILVRISATDEEVDHELRVEEHRDDPHKVLVGIVDELSPELLVVGTRRQATEEGARGVSVSEKAALDTDVPTLVLHIGQEGIVDANGQLRLQRVLVPVGDGAEARDTLRGLTQFLDALAVDDVDIYLLRVGDAEILDHLRLPERQGWRWHREVRKRGFVANQVAKLCDERDIDLISMASRGKDGFIDVFSGTHTEKVIRRAPRPVLVVSARDEVE